MMLRRLPLLFSLLSCGSTVELSSAPVFLASADPTVLGTIDERVGAIAVDDQRVYWIGTRAGDSTGYGGDNSLRSCRKQDCVGSLITYESATVHERMSFGVRGGRVYWLHLTDAPGPSRTWSVVECPVEGCGPMGPQTRATGLVEPNAVAYGLDALYAFLPSQGLVKVPLNGEVTEPRAVLSTSIEGTSAPLVHDGHLYWLRYEGGHLPSLVRLSLQGAGDIEVLAREVSFNFTGMSLPAERLAADSSYIYWSEGGLRGSIVRCALSGCIGAPEVLLTPVRSPMTLFVDQGELYYQHDTASQGFALSGCPIARCKTATSIVQGVNATNALASDADYLYTATSDQLGDTDWSHPSAHIRRIPR